MKKHCLIVIFSLLLGYTYAQVDNTTLEEEVETTAPEFPGGLFAFKEYIHKHLVYPRRAKQKAIEGKVYVQFIVEADGSLSSIHISKSLSKECDDEVIRLMKKSPRWIPATENRVPVKNWMIVPVEFKLKKED